MRVERHVDILTELSTLVGRNYWRNEGKEEVGGRINTPSAKPASAGTEPFQHSLLHGLSPIISLTPNFEAIRKLSLCSERSLCNRCSRKTFAIAVARSYSSPYQIDLPDHAIAVCPISLPNI